MRRLCLATILSTWISSVAAIAISCNMSDLLDQLPPDVVLTACGGLCDGTTCHLGDICFYNCTTAGLTGNEAAAKCSGGDIWTFIGNIVCQAGNCTPETCDLFTLVEALPADISILCTPDEMNPSDIRTVCQVNCTAPGFTGSSTFTCAGADTWVGVPLTCNPVACPAFHPEGEEDERRLRNCTGTFAPGESCRIRCRGKYKYCGMDSAELDCVGVSPGVSVWVGNPNCCSKYEHHKRNEAKHRRREHENDGRLPI
jgi:hypothetical protein